MNKSKSARNTLLWSVILSLPGPICVALGLLIGHSSTQIADFVRRIAELTAIIMSFVVYNNIAKTSDEEKKQKAERYSNTLVGVMMCIAGIIMIFLTLVLNSSDKGNVIPGLVVAACGTVTNLKFWRKYISLNKSEPNAIFVVQIRLYRAKTLIDASIAVALLFVLIAPESSISFWLDMLGSLIVAVYLIMCGARSIYEVKKM